MKTPPHSEEKEMMIFSYLIVYTEKTHEVIASLTEEDFFTPTARRIFHIFQKACERYTDVSIVQINELCGSDIEILDVLLDMDSDRISVTEKQLLQTLEDLRYYTMARSIVGTMYEIEKVLTKREGSGSQVMSQVQSLFNNATNKSTFTNVKTGDVVLRELYDQWAEYVDGDEEKRREMRGVSTGFKNIDSIIKGMKKGQYIILAANPSVGKTTLALNILKNVVESGKRVLIFSLEMDKEEIVKKMYEMYTRKPIDDMLKDEKSFLHVSPYIERASALSRMYIEDYGTMRTTTMREIIASHIKGEGVDLVIVDYLQLITPNNTKVGKVQQVGDMSREINAIAKDLKVPMLCLSQLNRENMKTTGFQKNKQARRPVLSDLRDSGNLEQDADVVMMLHRRDYQTQEQSSEVKNVEVWIRKNRTGPVGGVNLLFKPNISCFVDDKQSVHVDIDSDVQLQDIEF